MFLCSRAINRPDYRGGAVDAGTIDLTSSETVPRTLDTVRQPITVGRLRTRCRFSGHGVSDHLPRSVRLRLGLSAFAISALALTSCGPAKADKVESGVHDSARAPLSIAGITIGMPGVEIAPALRTAGYAVKIVSSSGRSWSYQVASRAADLTHSVPVQPGSPAKELELVEGARENERIFIRLVISPDGPRVANVIYKGVRPAATAPSNLSDLIAKYGAPSLRRDDIAFWCSKGEPNCRPSSTQLPSIFYGGAPGDLRFELASGRRQDAELNARMNVDVAAKTGKVGRSF